MDPEIPLHVKQATQLARSAMQSSDVQSTNDAALALFRLQARHVPVYREFVKTLGVDPEQVKTVEDIPYLPISFFKSHEVLMEGAKAEIEFQSSGTTGMERSTHRVADLDLYEHSSITAFEQLFGPLQGLCILALLPNYIEQSASSLIYMVGTFMERSGHPDNGFFLDQFNRLEEKLLKLEASGQRTLLIGVPYALLDFLEKRHLELKHTILMETGGMKGRRKEMVRHDLHEILKKHTGLSAIHSEYGMTELLSQAYSLSNGLFQTPPWMRVRIREVNDPFTTARNGKTGGIDIMDLANAHSCAFISTMDLGRQIDDVRFEILGRFDNSDVRGCNLLVQ